MRDPFATTSCGRGLASWGSRGGMQDEILAWDSILRILPLPYPCFLMTAATGGKSLSTPHQHQRSHCIALPSGAAAGDALCCPRPHGAYWSCPPPWRDQSAGGLHLQGVLWGPSAAGPPVPWGRRGGWAQSTPPSAKTTGPPPILPVLPSTSCSIATVPRKPGSTLPIAPSWKFIVMHGSGGTRCSKGWPSGAAPPWADSLAASSTCSSTTRTRSWPSRSQGTIRMITHPWSP